MKKQTLKLSTVDLAGKARNTSGIISSLDQSHEIYLNAKKTVPSKVESYGLHTLSGVGHSATVILSTSPQLPKIRRCRVPNSKESELHHRDLPTFEELFIRVRHLCQDIHRTTAAKSRLTLKDSFPLRKCLEADKGPQNAGNLTSRSCISQTETKSRTCRKERYAQSARSGVTSPSSDSLSAPHPDFCANPLQVPVPLMLRATSSALHLFRQSRQLQVPQINDNEKLMVRSYRIDRDADRDLGHSMTLPRIESVLKSEGISSNTITQQLRKIKERGHHRHA